MRLKIEIISQIWISLELTSLALINISGAHIYQKVAANGNSSRTMKGQPMMARPNSKRSVSQGEICQLRKDEKFRD